MFPKDGYCPFVEQRIINPNILFQEEDGERYVGWMLEESKQKKQ